MHHQKFGYTLIELMITLVIALSILMLSVFTMTSYMPKQRLLDSVETTEQTLSRAQFEATARSTWSCVKYNPTSQMMTVYMDSVTPFHGAASSCGAGADLVITSQQIREGILFASCTGTGSSGSETSYDFSADEIWFNSAGVPQYCTGGTCTPTSFQVILSSSDLPTGNKAREVEALSSGMISIIKRNEKGFLDGVFAKSGELPTGCE